MRYIILVLIIFCVGCSTFGSNPVVLTSSEQMWTIPAGTKFTAIQKPKFPNPKEFIVNDADLAVIYKGNLLKLEEEANSRVIKATRQAKKTGTIWGAIGSLLSIIAGLVTKNLISKKNTKKKK